MHFFRLASIQQKQMRIIMGIFSLALLLAIAGFVTCDWLSRRAEMASFLLSRCDVLGRTCWGVLDFKDPKAAAAENLNALKGDPHMISATVFTEDGNIFARYGRTGATTPAPGLVSTNAASIFDRDKVRAVRPILRGDERLGFIVLESDLEALDVAMKYQGRHRHAGLHGGQAHHAAGRRRGRPRPHHHRRQRRGHPGGVPRCFEWNGCWRTPRAGGAEEGSRWEAW